MLAINDIGFIAIVTSLVEQVLGNVRQITIINGFMIAGTIFTNFCSNLGTATALFPIAIKISIAMGMNPAIVTLILRKACHFAYFTPAASPATALCMANKAWIDVKTVYKFGFTIVVIEWILTVAVATILGSILL